MKIRTLIGVAAALCTSGVAMAQNDLCANAIAVSIPSSTSSTTVGATVDTGAPTCVTTYSAPGVWYTVIGNGNNLSANLCTASYDTKIHVYTGSCATLSALTCVTGNDDSALCVGATSHSFVNWCSTNGTEYKILVSGFSAGTGTFTLAIADNGPCGACCAPAGTCTLVASASCAATSSFRGAGTTCTPNLCGALSGSCCNVTAGTCTVTFSPTPSGTPAGCPAPGVFNGLGTTCTPNPCGGACCNGTTCTTTGPSGCAFSYQGTGTVCTPNPCSGACCTSAGVCTATNPAGCVSPNVYKGAGSVCSPTPCPNATCTPAITNDECVNAIAFSGSGFDVFSNTTCATTDPSPAISCIGTKQDQWWVFVPDATANYSIRTCAAGTGSTVDTVISVHTACPTITANNQMPVGAPGVTVTCNDDSCNGGIGPSTINSITLQAGTSYWIRVALWSGASAANNAPFELVVGAIVGSCCNNTNGSCSVTTQAACPAPNAWTNGAVCTSSTCAGACCNPDGTCSALASVAGCNAGSAFQGLGTLCANVSCPIPTGACCSGTGVCSVGPANTCTSPSVFQGANSVCIPDPCAALVGSCCINGVCSSTILSGCSGGTFQGAGTVCTPNPCPQPLPNDTCGSATNVSVGTPAATGDNSTATSTGETVTCTTISKGVWYKFTAPSAGTYVFDTEGSLQTDTVLAIFSDCGTGNGGTQLACDDDSGTGNLSSITLVMTNSQFIIIEVGSFGGAATGGDFRLNISQIITGACCASTGVCTTTTSAACTSGYQGDNTSCTPNPCPQPASCCVGSCCSLTLSAALCSGTWGASATCTPNPCPATANDACANAVAISSAVLPVTVTGDNCNATADGPAGTCATGTANSVWWSFTPTHTASYKINTCGSAFDTVLTVFSGDCTTPVEVGCDDDEATCTNTLNSQIAAVTLSAGQTYLIRVGSFSTGTGAISVTIDANAALGSCCATDGSCTQTDLANCAATFNSGGTCTPNTCPQPNGACCCGSNCTVTAPAACAGTGQVFSGAGSTCLPFSNTAPCCRGDYNKVNNISVQDIFDFLAGYFGNSLCADTNDTGTISVQDIFDYLAAYFGGGC